MMKMYARTDEKSYLNNYNGEDWQAVTTTFKRFPSGLRECVRFNDGYVAKIDYCEVCYVFDK